MTDEQNIDPKTDPSRVPLAVGFILGRAGRALDRDAKSDATDGERIHALRTTLKEVKAKALAAGEVIQRRAKADAAGELVSDEKWIEAQCHKCGQRIAFDAGRFIWAKAESIGAVLINSEWAEHGDTERQMPLAAAVDVAMKCPFHGNSTYFLVPREPAGANP